MNLKKVRITKGHISGVRSRELTVHQDDRGFLFEMLRLDWDEAFTSLTIGESKTVLGSKEHQINFQKIKQIYIVQNTDNNIRAYHKHEHLVDIFCMVSGQAKFILVDDRKGSKTFGNMEIVNMCGRKPEILVVPAGVFHGWKGSKDCTLIAVANDLYKGINGLEEIDEERIPWDYFGKDIWETEFK